MPFCTSCGRENPPEARFCAACGRPSGAPPPPAAPYYPATPPPPPPQYAQANVYVTPPAAPPAGSQKSGCIAALLGWFFPGAGQMYAGQMGCGCTAMAVTYGLYGVSTAAFILIAAGIQERKISESEAWVALLPYIGFAAGGLLWLISFIMGIVAANKK